MRNKICSQQVEQPQQMGIRFLSTGRKINLNTQSQSHKIPDILLAMKNLQKSFIINTNELINKTDMKNTILFVLERLQEIFNIEFGIEVERPTILVLDSKKHESVYRAKAPEGVDVATYGGDYFVFSNGEGVYFVVNFDKFKNINPDTCLPVLIHELVGLEYISAHNNNDLEQSDNSAKATYDFDVSLIIEGWCCFLSGYPFGVLELVNMEMVVEHGGEGVLADANVLSILKERHFFPALALLKIYLAFGQEAFYEYFTILPGNHTDSNKTEIGERPLLALYDDYEQACEILGNKPIPQRFIINNAFAES